MPSYSKMVSNWAWNTSSYIRVKRKHPLLTSTFVFSMVLHLIINYFQLIFYSTQATFLHLISQLTRSPITTFYGILDRWIKLVLPARWLPQPSKNYEWLECWIINRRMTSKTKIRVLWKLVNNFIPLIHELEIVLVHLVGNTMFCWATWRGTSVLNKLLWGIVFFIIKII